MAQSIPMTLLSMLDDVTAVTRYQDNPELVIPLLKLVYSKLAIIGAHVDAAWDKAQGGQKS